MSGVDVSFSFFCSLLHEISQTPSHRARLGHRYNQPNYPALDILRRWIKRLKENRPIIMPVSTTTTVFKLLFPREDHYRIFDMQETRLAENLAECFGFNKGKLKRWASENSRGCLGHELKHVLEEVCPVDSDYIGPLSIIQVDELLDELASTSMYTDVSIRDTYGLKRRARLSIIKDLFRTLSPMEAGFLTQIILKDLRPILYPLEATHPVTALLDYNQASIKMLSIEDAMIAWDPTRQMLQAYQVQSTLSKAAEYFQAFPGLGSSHVPQIGTPVQVPRCEKGQSSLHALGYFRPFSQVWAEIKYDGERAQIHVELGGGGPSIQIFSKSKRDSTWDRKAIHDCVYRALGLSEHKNSRLYRIRKNVILDAEMVAFHGEKIDEFWRIRGLVAQTATGIRGHPRSAADKPSGFESFSPPSTEKDDFDGRRLGLVFFDVIMVDSKPQLMTPYWRRREILENLIQVIPGECILSSRVLVGSSVGIPEEKRVEALEKIFSDAITMAEEGIVLKGHESKYHGFSTPWVKLKKDYIPGYGDTVDLVIVAIGWEKERARELRVPPSILTTFFMGGQENEKEQQSSDCPHFHVYFTVSYGQSRHQLEQTNFYMQNSETVPYNSSLESSTLGYTFTLPPGLPCPTLLLKTPLLGEIFGAGFTKSYKSHHYEVRFPRLNKIYRPTERSWKEAITLEDLHNVACRSLQRENSTSFADKAAAELWGKSSGSGDVMKQKGASGKLATGMLQTWGQAGKSLSCATQKPMELQNNPAESTTLDKFARVKHHTVTEPAYYQEATASLKDSWKLLGAGKPFTSLENTISMLSSEQGSRLLSHTGSLVWFPQPGSESLTILNWPSLQEQQIHSLYSLMVGCRWVIGTPGASWVKRGVVFVDECDDKGKSLGQHVQQLLEEHVLSLPTDHPRKKIWLLRQGDWMYQRKGIKCQVL